MPNAVTAKPTAPIHPRVSAVLPSIRSLCERYAVKRLGLFGSAARDDWDPRCSDFDFVVDFAKDLDLPWYGQLTGLIADLEQLLQRPVDVVVRNCIRNPYLAEEINTNEVIVFGDPLRDKPFAQEAPSMTDQERNEHIVHDALVHIEQAAARIIDRCGGKTLSDYEQDQDLRDIVERQFTVIGEAVGRLRKARPELGQQVTASKTIVAFRNLIVHNYDLVDENIVWDVVTKHLPQLHSEVRQLLEPDRKA